MKTIELGEIHQYGSIEEVITQLQEYLAKAKALGLISTEVAINDGGYDSHTIEVVGRREDTEEEKEAAAVQRRNSLLTQMEQIKRELGK